MVAADGCEFPKYSFTIAQHLAHTFLDERDEEVFGVDREEFAYHCEAMEHDPMAQLQGSNRPDQYDYQDDQKTVDKLKRGKVEVKIHRVPAQPKQGTNVRNAVSSQHFRRCSTGDASQLAQGIDEMLKLYMLADFPKHDDIVA